MAQLLAHKPVNFASLSDSFIVSFSDPSPSDGLFQNGTDKEKKKLKTPKKTDFAYLLLYYRVQGPFCDCLRSVRAVDVLSVFLRKRRPCQKLKYGDCRVANVPVKNSKLC